MVARPRAGRSWGSRVAVSLHTCTCRWPSAFPLHSLWHRLTPTAWLAVLPASAGLPRWRPAAWSLLTCGASSSSSSCSGGAGAAGVLWRTRRHRIPTHHRAALRQLLINRPLIRCWLAAALAACRFRPTHSTGCDAVRRTPTSARHRVPAHAVGCGTRGAGATHRRRHTFAMGGGSQRLRFIHSTRRRMLRLCLGLSLRVLTLGMVVGVITHTCATGGDR